MKSSKVISGATAVVSLLMLNPWRVRSPGRARRPPPSSSGLETVVAIRTPSAASVRALRRGDVAAKLRRFVVGADHQLACARNRMAREAHGESGSSPRRPRLRPAPRRAGTHRPGRCRRPRSHGSMSSSEGTHSTGPLADRRSVAVRLQARRDARVGIGPVMPRPISAGVLGIARTTGRSPGAPR